MLQGKHAKRLKGNYQTANLLMTVTVVVTDTLGLQETCSATVTVDNMSLVLDPRALSLRSRGQDLSVTAMIEGLNVDILLPVEWRNLSGLAAANGLVTFGLYTAFMVEMIRQIRREQVSGLPERG